MKINPKGYWENPTPEGHGIDRGLAKGLSGFFWLQSLIHDRRISVIDVGCGTGFYTNYLNKNSEEMICHGYDGNPNTPKLSDFTCEVFDFTKPAEGLGKWDWVLSLETGEHIPIEYENQFIHNLDILNDLGIILSWAVEGQGGDGHVNCRNNDYIIKRFGELGYYYSEKNTNVLRFQAAVYPNPCYWFRDTLMVFFR